MRLALACLALLAIAASPRGGGCGTPTPPYEPCAGKLCGAACTICDPADSSCAETAVLKACDPGGACVPSGAYSTCPPAATDPCAGRSCGDACTVEPACRSATPPCMMPTLLGHCDASGVCVAADPSCLPSPPPPTPDPCKGKACGDPCNPCGDASPCPTLVASACDRFGVCSGVTPGMCWDPCAGKACHAACDPCPPGGACPAVLCTTWCDGGGRCTCAGGGAACP